MAPLAYGHGGLFCAFRTDWDDCTYVRYSLADLYAKYFYFTVPGKLDRETIDGATSGTRNLWQHARVWNIWHTGPITNQTKITRNKRNIHSNLNCSVSNSVK